MNDTKVQLNSIEKRNLQRLMFADIETASAKYRSARAAARRALEDSLIANPPPEAKKLAAEIERASKEANRARDELGELGYTTAGYPAGTLSIWRSKEPPVFGAFDTETSRTEARIVDLKRDYTLRLFAQTDAPGDLFRALTDHLAHFLSEAGSPPRHVQN